MSTRELREFDCKLNLPSRLTSAPWIVGWRTGDLDAPVIHYLPIDEAIDCDSAHRKTLPGVRESRLWFSDIFTANRPSHDHLVFRRENIVDDRFAIRKKTWP